MAWPHEGNLAPCITEEQVTEIFREFGEKSDVLLNVQLA